MKAFFPFLFIACFLTAKPSPEPEAMPVKIEQVNWSPSKQLDYERIIEIDSIIQELQNEQSSLIDQFHFASGASIVRATIREDLPIDKGRSFASYRNTPETDQDRKPVGVIRTANKPTREGSNGFTNASLTTGKKPVFIEQETVLAQSSKLHP